MKVLILFAHPAFQKSRVNKILIEGIEHIEGITFHDLYESYPEFDIDVKKEQQLLLEHDVVVFHHPLFWYSTPAILKEWQDLVYEHGWAFGSEGDALKGKLFFCVVTSGGPRQAYQPRGYHKHTLNQLLLPIRQTAMLCKMTPLPPFVVHGTHAIEANEILDHKNDYFALLKQIARGELNIDKAQKLDYLNHYLKKEDM